MPTNLPLLHIFPPRTFPTDTHTLTSTSTVHQTPVYAHLISLKCLFTRVEAPAEIQLRVTTCIPDSTLRSPWGGFIEIVTRHWLLGPPAPKLCRHNIRCLTPVNSTPLVCRATTTPVALSCLSAVLHQRRHNHNHSRPSWQGLSPFLHNLLIFFLFGTGAHLPLTVVKPQKLGWVNQEGVKSPTETGRGQADKLVCMRSSSVQSAPFEFSPVRKVRTR